ncbi:TSUP family transporter [Sagittula sp. S175]|uniref:TSUP family transporter n=1 Tax=Sagittula sp. S175 TaxID=3415129 RepID=UPI003C7AECC8
MSITFLNAMKPDRAVFVATISLFFLAMTLVQIPAMAWYGLLTPTLALGSAAALVPLLAAMPLGAVLAKRLPKEVFDKAILLLLADVACKLLWDALM